jgi:hypothetical protein
LFDAETFHGERKKSRVGTKPQGVLFAGSKEVRRGCLMKVFRRFGEMSCGDRVVAEARFFWGEWTPPGSSVKI